MKGEGAALSEPRESVAKAEATIYLRFTFVYN